MAITCGLKKINYTIPGWYGYRETKGKIGQICNVSEPCGIQTIAVYEFVEEGKPDKKPDAPEGLFDMTYFMFDPANWISQNISL